MLTKLDDLPRHQIVETMAHVASSDLTWSDGYYFCFWDPAGEVSLAMGMRVYANVDVMDGYVSLLSGGTLRNTRMSRRWSPRQDDLEVGPLRLQIIEGLRQRRLAFHAPDLFGGIEFDILWEARHAPFAEARKTERLSGRTIRDLIRYWQAGRPTGRIRFDSRELTIDPTGWYCIMDHSWGTRQSVGPGISPGDLPPVPVLPPGRDGLLRLVVFAQMPSYIVYFQTHEDASGTIEIADGRIDFTAGDSAAIVRVEHNLSYKSGTRVIDIARCTITDSNGRRYELLLQPSHTPTVSSAFGYSLERRGWTDDRGMGVYRGEDYIESDTWRHDGHESVDPTGKRHPYNGYIGPARVTAGNESGMAYFETVVIGSYERYGFKAEGPVPVTVLPIS
jgi:hypothetical protein